MPVFCYKCNDCDLKFDEFKQMPYNYTVIKSDYAEPMYIVEDKPVSEEEYNNLTDTMKDISCPKCKGINLSKLLSGMPAVVYSDEIRPGSGFATVDKRHELGMYWDQDPATKKEVDSINRDMREESKKSAAKMAQKDEEVIRKTYRQCSAAEAKDILSNPNRTEELVSINEDIK